MTDPAPDTQQIEMLKTLLHDSRTERTRLADEVDRLRARAVPDLTPCPFCTPEGLSREDEYVVAGAAQTLDGDPPFSEEALLAVGGDLLAIVRRLTKEPK